jgi:hypothetical protein
MNKNKAGGSEGSLSWKCEEDQCQKTPIIFVVMMIHPAGFSIFPEMPGV